MGDKRRAAIMKQNRFTTLHQSKAVRVLNNQIRSILDMN
jgi:hypothetical protein